MIVELMREAELQPDSQEALLISIAQLEDAYESGEALGRPLHCNIGLEIDYNLEEDEDVSRLDETAYRDRYGRPRHEIEADRDRLSLDGREFIRAELAALVPHDAEEAERQVRWLQQVGHLTLPELVTYFAYRELSRPTLADIRGLDPREDDDDSVLEFCFGQDFHQVGYYDNPDQPEARTVPCPPTEALANRNLVTAVFARHARHYGLGYDAYNTQINMSVQDDEGNIIHVLDAPASQDVAREATAGILVAVRDMVPVTLPRLRRNAKPFSYRAGPLRTDTLRVIYDRFEQRTGCRSRTAVHANTLAMMSGFVQGLNDPERIVKELGSNIACETTPYQHFVPAEDFDKATDLHILRALQHSTIAEDGSMMLEMEYARRRGADIIRSFFGSDAVHTTRGLDHAIVQGFIRTVRYTEGQGLVIDENALEDWWDGLGFRGRFAAANRTAHHRRPRPELLEERLRRVRLAGTVTTIRSDEISDELNPVTWHAALARFAGSSALRPCIPKPVRDLLHKELSGLFTHETAVAELVVNQLNIDLDHARMEIEASDEGRSHRPPVDGDPDISGALRLLARHLDGCDAVTLLSAVIGHNRTVIGGLRADLADTERITTRIAMREDDLRIRVRLVAEEQLLAFAAAQGINFDRED